LRGRPVEFTGDLIPLRVGVDSELDRFVGFGIGDFVMFHNGCQVSGFHPRLTTPCHVAARTQPLNSQLPCLVVLWAARADDWSSAELQI
jgi:hypothetical protein